MEADKMLNPPTNARDAEMRFKAIMTERGIIFQVLGSGVQGGQGEDGMSERDDLQQPSELISVLTTTTNGDTRSNTDAAEEAIQILKGRYIPTDEDRNAIFEEIVSQITIAKTERSNTDALALASLAEQVDKLQKALDLARKARLKARENALKEENKWVEHVDYLKAQLTASEAARVDLIRELDEQCKLTLKAVNLCNEAEAARVKAEAAVAEMNAEIVQFSNNWHRDRSHMGPYEECQFDSCKRNRDRPNPGSRLLAQLEAAKAMRDCLIEAGQPQPSRDKEGNSGNSRQLRGGREMSTHSSCQNQRCDDCFDEGWRAALSDLQAPSPCGVEGHTRATWDDSHSPRLDNPDSESERLVCCLRCAEIAAVIEGDKMTKSESIAFRIAKAAKLDEADGVSKIVVVAGAEEIQKEIAAAVEAERERYTSQIQKLREEVGIFNGQVDGAFQAVQILINKFPATTNALEIVKARSRLEEAEYWTVATPMANATRLTELRATLARLEKEGRK